MACVNDRYITSGMRKCACATRILFAVALAVQLLAISASPEEVPIHWGMSGKADAHGSPWLMLLFWGGMAAAAGCFELVARNLDVEFWNKPRKLEEGRLESWYALSMRISYGTSLVLSFTVLAVAVACLLHAYGWISRLAIAFMAALFGYYIFEHARWRRQG